MRLILFLLVYGLIITVLFTSILLSDIQIHKMDYWIVIALLAIIYPAIKLSSLISKNLKTPNIELSNTQALTAIIELIIPSIFSFLLIEYRDKLKYGYYDGSFDDSMIFVLSSTYFIILFTEWKRRCKTDKDKPAVYKYVYIIVMLITFILSMLYVQLFFDES